MAVLTTGNTFSNGDQVTASSLNNAVNDAEFAAGAVDGISTQKSGSGAIIVKDLGISRGKIAIDAVGTDQLANDVVINTSGSITGAAGSFTTLSASSGYTGNVTGNVTGNLTGNVTGNVTGDVTGNISGNVTGGTGSFTTLAASGDTVLSSDLEINVSGASNTSKAIVINSSGTNLESDAGIIQATHAGSGSLTGGYWLKFNANSADRFTVRGDGRTEISSTTGGVILPRMTTTQKNAISSPANGEMVYDTDLNKFYGYANGAWVALH